MSRRCLALLKDTYNLSKNDSPVKFLQCGKHVSSELPKWYCSISSSNILKLHDRGIFQTVYPPERTPQLSHCLSAPITVYCGFDPTAASLHIGNLLAIISLIHCQRGGHNPICVIGGATALIGDPSGRTKDRSPMTAEEIENNIISITESLHRIFNNHQQYIWSKNKPLPEVKILNNASWYKDRNVIEFLSSVGRHFRMSKMLQKTSVDSRINSPEGMNFTEFTYQIFQAYDWYYLLKKYNCLVQIGGHDQLGNMSSGNDFISRVTSEDVFGLTVPLVKSSTGDKLGKTAGNAIWLNPNKTSPFELYQYFLNLPDADVESHLNLFTFLPDKEVKDALTKQKIHVRHCQKKIAKSVTTLVHGENGLEEAIKWTKALYSGNIEDLAVLDKSQLKQLFKSATTVQLIYEPGISIYDVCMKAKCFAKEADANRIIQAGGVYINHKQVKEPDYVLLPGQHILPNDITLIRVGKKNYYIVEWTQL